MRTMKSFSQGLPKASWIYLTTLAVVAAVVMTVFVGFAQQVEASAPPAGAQIGGVAIATYADENGVLQQVTSNLVTTTVQQVYSHTLTASQTKLIAPGGAIVFPLTLSNTGNGADTYTLSTEDIGGSLGLTGIEILSDETCSGTPSSTTAITTVTLAAGATSCLVVKANAPTGKSAGDQHVINIGSVSSNAGDLNNYVASVTDPVDPEAGVILTAEAQTAAVMQVTQSYSVISGPAQKTIDVTFKYTNNGGEAATNFTLTDTIGGSGTVGGATPFDTTDMTYVANSGVINGYTVTDADDVEATAPGGITYKIVGNDITVVIPSVAVGESGTVTFTVDVDTTAGAELTSNAAGFVDATNTTPQATNAVKYMVDLSSDAGVVIGDQDPLGLVTSASNNASGYTAGSLADASLTDPDDANALDDGVEIASASQGATLMYNLVLTNMGAATDRFNLSLGDGLQDPFPTDTKFVFVNASGVPYSDTNGDGVVNTGAVASGASVNVFLQVQLPSSVYVTTSVDKKVIASSILNGAAQDSTYIVLGSMVQADVDLTLDEAYSANNGTAGNGFKTASGSTLDGGPNGTTVFTLWVENRGSVVDNYNLSAGSGNSSGATLDALLANWVVTFKATGTANGGANCPTAGATVVNTGMIASGGACEFQALVQVPAGTLAGDYPIYFRVFSPLTGQAAPVDAGYDILDALVSVFELPGLSFNPTRSAQVFSGGSVNVSHLLCNTGNIDTDNVPTIASVSSSTGWTSDAYYDADDNGEVGAAELSTGEWPLGYADPSIAGGQCVSIVNRVLAPSGANPGENNTVTLTASTAFGGDAISVAVQELVTVISGTVKAVKKQQKVTDCAGTPTIAGAWSTDPLDGAPGECIAYQVTATNVGADDATGVTILDSTPDYTTQVTGGDCAVAVSASGTIDTSGPDDYKVSQATLSPGEALTLQYCVRIDE